MRSSQTLLALAATLSTAAAQLKGFNYGSSNTDGSFKYEADFSAEFTLAQNLVGTTGFNAARLYTMIQGGSSTNEPIQAIPAAIKTKTKLLLGLWASGGQDLVVGISVGSEDLYRISPTGVAAKSGYGAEPATIAAYIKSLRSAIAGTSLSGASVGHVDTWTAWVNGTNQAVIDAVDWVGVDAYPYFQNTMDNGISNGKSLFNEAFSNTQAAVGGKDVWITETGWPVSGPTENLAVASTSDAQQYWRDVGCPNFGKVNTFWYTLMDAGSSPSFGVAGADLSTTPLYDLSCSSVSSSSSSSSASSTGSLTKTASSLTATSSGAVVTGGAGLSPSQGIGSGSGANVTATGAGAAPTAGVSTNYTSPATGPSGTAGSGSGSGSGSGTGSGSGSTTSTPISVNSASVMKGSFVAGLAIAFAAVFAL
ncbi:putative glucan endo-1,3-beta-glucosidase eglC [Glarea lozoyensis 74030]|uniref:Probable glucan endo-1,3-beta-glucosidase eglC n=1 Tax=Glarea lozoyensis (strain ATCC 74030 / MF5533) TaxID=1104152 RepID=H0EK11_GLAL7|nr:putative glucan endo-1,3-beta-glucosidase eglC [Glarea lozoyensis 74030]